MVKLESLYLEFSGCGKYFLLHKSAMARATKCRTCVFEFNCCITGHHIYKDIWTPRTQEELTCKTEPDNQHDKYAVKVLKDGEIVGHIPRLFSKTCTLILLSGGCMKVCVTGKRRGAGGPLFSDCQGVRTYSIKSRTNY